MRAVGSNRAVRGKNVELSVFPLQDEEVSVMVMMMGRRRETGGTSTETLLERRLTLDELKASWYDGMYAAVAYSTLEETDT